MKKIVLLFFLLIAFVCSTNLEAATLTIPTEGVYDKTVDTKNTAGVMTERKYYYKGTLVEKRTYTSVASSNCRMRNKYLYYSNGSTVYRHRTYSYSGAECYNLQTKEYSTASNLQAVWIYEGKVDGDVIESRYYDTSGTYYTAKTYYKDGKATSKEYWLGKSGNYITHIANYNSAGTEWIKATYYYNVSKDIKEITNHTGKTPNSRTNATGYREDGTKSYYIAYDASGDRYSLTYYDASGTKKKQEARYHAGISVWAWDIIYQANGIDRESVRYRDEEGTLTKSLHYYNSGNKLKWEIEYDEEGAKSHARGYDESTGKVTSEEWYVDGVIDIVEYFDLEGKTSRKVRYFKDGVHLRWDITYLNGVKKEVKLYKDSNSSEYVVESYFDEFINIANDLYRNKKEGNLTYSDVFEDSVLKKVICENVGLKSSSAIYLEDLFLVNDITVNNNEELKSESGLEIVDPTEEVDTSDSHVEDMSDEDTPNDDSDDELNDSQKVLVKLDGIKYLYNLESIKINNTLLSVIGEEISTLKKLKKLDLSNNTIHTISTEIGEMDWLEELYLSNNGLSSTENIFKNMESVKIIDLRGNELQFLSKDLINLSNYKLENLYIDNDNLNIKETDIEDFSKVKKSNIFMSNDDKINEITSYYRVNTSDLKFNDGDAKKQIVTDYLGKIYDYCNSVGCDSSEYQVKFGEKNYSDNEDKLSSKDKFIQLNNLDDFKVVKNKLNFEFEEEYFKEAGTYLLNINYNVEGFNYTINILLEKVNISDSEVNNEVKNIDELGVDIVNDMPLAAVAENETKLYSDNTALDVSIQKQNADLSLDTSLDKMKISLDENIKYDKVNDASIKYNGENNFSVNAQIIDGGARYIFDIENKNAPKEYKIRIDLPENAKMVQDSAGGFHILNDKQEIIALIGAPWAVDKNGDFVDTHYELRGNSLYQVLDYSGDNYPLKADPLFCNDLINNSKTKWYGNATYLNKQKKKKKGIYRVYARGCTKGYLSVNWVLSLNPVTGLLPKLLNQFSNSSIAKQGWKETRNDYSFTHTAALKNKAGAIQDQFFCHAVNPLTIWKSSWNLEPGRPDVSLVDTYKNACNP